MKTTKVQGAPLLPQLGGELTNPKTVQKSVDLSQVGQGRHAGLEAKVVASDPQQGLSSQIQARLGTEKAYSMPPEQLKQLLVGEITNAFEFAGTLSNAITAFGGARVTPDHPFFEVGKQWGEALFLTNLFAVSPEWALKAIASGKFSTEANAAARSVMTGLGVGEHGAVAFGQALAAVGGAGTPDAVTAALALLEANSPGDRALKVQQAAIRSGAGPGMMEAVAIGYVKAREQLEALFPDAPKAVLEELKTQGSRIVLPFEQETSPFIEKLQNFVHFLPRRLALTEATDGFVTFPGGFGTLNEAFEVLRAGRANHFESSKFWKPSLDAITKAWTERGLAGPETLKLITIGDGAADGLPKLLQSAAALPEAPAPTKARAEAMAADLIRGLQTLAELPTAITFFGGKGLGGDDPAVKVAARIAGKLAKGGAPIRVGGDGHPLSDVAAAAKKADKSAEVQGILRSHEGMDQRAIDAKIDVHETVGSDPVHKVLLYENTDAFVVLPGGVGTFDELWEIACLMQTGKMPKKPIVLVDDGFWGPILDAMHQAMALGDSKTISPDDMRYFTVVKTSGKIGPEDANKSYAVVDEATAVAQIRHHRAERENA